MKSILKNALVGLLLVAGTTKPVATLEQVKTALIPLIPIDGKIVDSTLKNNIGTLNLSYPIWLSCQIINVLKRGIATDKCTVWNGLNGVCPYVRTIDSNHSDDKGKKLVTVTEDGTIVCGILFLITANEYTAEYITATEVMTLLNKNCMQVERGLSAYQLPLKWILGVAAVVGAGYGGYRLLKYGAYQVRFTMLTDLGFTPEQAAQKLSAQSAAIGTQVTPGQAAGVLAKGAGNVIGGVFNSAKDALKPKA
jgi:hypothetical protein